MKLIDLNPTWIGSGGEGVCNADGSPVPRREAVALEFDCPCGCDSPVIVALANPPDGGEPFDAGRDRPRWERTGTDFGALTLTPSIQRVYPNRCWHGFVTNGEIITC
jgi:hypothetical protein